MSDGQLIERPPVHDSRRSSADMMAEAAKRPGATLAKIPDGLKMGEDFPFICDICLGPNPYIRMMKLPMARECKISGRPYTAFRWQPGAEARYKETIICAEVAIAKNVCQVCLMDMEYNLPVRVRDQLMGNDNTRGVGGVQMPQSDVNKEFYWQNQRQLLEESSLQGFQALQDNGSAGGSAIGQTFDKLAHLSRNKQGHDKYYDRNLPKLCSFWTPQVRGWGYPNPNPRPTSPNPNPHPKPNPNPNPVCSFWTRQVRGWG